MLAVARPVISAENAKTDFAQARARGERVSSTQRFDKAGKALAWPSRDFAVQQGLQSSDRRELRGQLTAEIERRLYFDSATIEIPFDHIEPQRAVWQIQPDVQTPPLLRDANREPRQLDHCRIAATRDPDAGAQYTRIRVRRP
jgi:hypothetical protein